VESFVKIDRSVWPAMLPHMNTHTVTYIHKHNLGSIVTQSVKMTEYKNQTVSFLWVPSRKTVHNCARPKKYTVFFIKALNKSQRSFSDREPRMSWPKSLRKKLFCTPEIADNSLNTKLLLYALFD